MGRHNGSGEVTHKDFNEATAARTRPISLEEILSRRKNKLDIDGKKEAGEIKESSEKDNIGVLSDRGIERKELKDPVEGNSKRLEEVILKKEHEDFEIKDKENRDLKAKMKLKSSYNMSSDREIKNEKHIHHRTGTSNGSGAVTKKESKKNRTKVLSDRGIERKELKDPVEGNSKRLEEVILKKEHEDFEIKDKENRDLKAKMKLKSSYNMSSDREIKNEKHIHHRTGTSNGSGAVTKKESKKNRTKVLIEKDEDEDGERISRKDRKRKHESHIDDKNRSTIDGSIRKKHDSGNLRDAEYSGRKDRKKEYHKTRNEELNYIDDESRSAIDGSIHKKHESGKSRNAGCSERKDQEKEHPRTYHEEINCIDDKYRSATDGSVLKKHDSVKSWDAEYSEKKDWKKKHHQTHLEETNCNDARNRSTIDGSILKKHESGKSHNAAERKVWKKEHPRTHHEEPNCIGDRSGSAIDGSITKKRDSGKSRDAEYSESKDRKKEYSRTHNEEPKRRKSRSRDCDRERHRSNSMSPRVHKRSDHVRDYDESIFESSKDKSRHKYSEVDERRTSENGGYGSRRYRKHGSGLGGYSPRKRRTESAVKTPPPTKQSRSPQKKCSTWDQPPAGTNHGGAGSMYVGFQSHSSNTLKLVSSNAVTPSATKHQPIPSINAISTLINVSVDAVQLTQATRPMRRLYIENLPPSASEKSVIDCLNDILLASRVNRIQGAKPCISCIINKEKCQAVVEFLTPEDATSAISFDGRSLLGSVLKIRRPKDFVEAAVQTITIFMQTGVAEKIVPMVKAISKVVKDSPHKIFIGGISKALSSDMLREVVGAFGLLRAYHFAFNEELNGPCAFLEYEDHSITQKACAGLNGMKLGGKVLTSVQAFLDCHGEEDNMENPPSYDIPSHAKSLLADSTKVLQIKNVFKPEEFPLLSDSELEEILEDIRLECTRFGTVKSINVVRLNSKCECAIDVSKQGDPYVDDSVKIQSGTNVDAPTSNINVKELQESGNDKENTNNNDTNPEDPERKESSNLSSANIIRVEENIVLESCSVSEIPLQTFDMENTANLEVHESNRNEEQIRVETTDRNNFDVNEGEVGNDGDSNSQTHGLEIFEPGSVLVEFLREAAACAAAHCLHLRCYGEQIVSASYVSHDLYMTRFLQ